MKTVLMRFGGYVWKNNPRSVQVTFRREVKEWKLPGKGNLLQDLGPEKRVAIGEGELFGEDCFYQFEQLAALCREGRKDFLVLPDSTGFEARLISLSMIGEAGPQAVGYRFEFWEQVAGESGTAEQSPQYHTVREG